MKKLISAILLPICIFALTSWELRADEEAKQQLTDAIQSYSATAQPVLETSVFNLINQQRQANGLNPLLWSNYAAQLARTHSLNMANKLIPFGHQGVEVRFATLRLQIPTLTRFGENVAYNYGYPNPAQVAVNGWLKSPGHYANIMGDFNLTGVGVAKNILGEYYFTQIFVKAATQTILNEEDSEEYYSEAAATVGDSPVSIEE